MGRGRQLRRTRAALLLALMPGALGIALSRWPAAASLEKNPGLDTLFRMRGPRQPPPGVCVVAIDEASYREIGRSTTLNWPRALHAQLIRTLAQEGARAVAFDVVFEGPGGDPAVDEALKSAIEETGIVVLGSSVETVSDPRFNEATIIEPYEPLARAAAAVADVNLPTDTDTVIRYAWPARDAGPGLALAAYEVGTGDRSRRSNEPRILDYYGQARTIPTRSMYQALDPKLLPPGFFRDKIVFVGLSMDSAPGAAFKDAFPTPFRPHGSTTFGVEIHATLAANLLESREVRLLDPRWEALLLFLLPLVATLVFMALRPSLGAAAFAVLMLVPWGVAHVAFARSLWIPVAIPSLIQMPVAYASSLLWYYLTTLRDRDKIKRVFGFYLAPEMIRQIAEDPDAVNLGGREVVGTAVFTDIKGFTPIAEGMSAPETAAMLNAYFSEATRHVFDAGGTLIKYIGDAVFAIWGAPIRRDDHATQACIAALSLARAEQSAGDSRLLTRIGVHTGPMLVGNLGSAQRFDYTAIGDAVNLASRIEGLNKTFGTRALASGETIAATDGRFVTRRLGLVRVVGRREPVELHELVAVQGEADAGAPMREAFARAHEAWRAGSFADAAAGFRQALALSGDADGPSAFFAKDAERRAAAGGGAAWDGVLVVETK